MQVRDGEYCVIAYASRRVKPTKLSMSIFQLKLLAIAFLCEHFADFITGIPVILHTDFKSITQFKTLRNLDSRTTRLLLKLQEFDLRFEHLAGTSKQIADRLTRSLPLVTSNECKEF